MSEEAVAQLMHELASLLDRLEEVELQEFDRKALLHAVFRMNRLIGRVMEEVV